MELSIVIVNWNSRDLLLRCVASIHTALGAAGHGVAGYEVIVVDNASSDGSVERAGLASGETVICNRRNAGFAAACNQGAQAASGEMLLMLNPDCELRPGSAERCLRELRRTDMAVGICGVALLDASGTVARSCERFFNFATLMGAATGLNALLPTRMGARMREWDHTEDRTVDHVIGAFYMLRADTLRALGGFDERFHVYYEDMDLSKRVHRSGLCTRFLAQPASFHLGGGVSSQIKDVRLFYSWRSRVLYAFKHLPRWQAWTHLAATLAVEPISRTLHAALRRSPAALVQTWRGYTMLVRDLPAILQRARLE